MAPRVAIRPKWWYHYEIPTWLVLLGGNAGWLLLTLYHASIPWWLLLLLGGYSVCLFGSLQHECLHGHPTRHAWMNKLLVWLPLALWMPYTIYRNSHIAHHQCQRLTDPREDPESFYIDPEEWQRMPGIARNVLTINNTLAGRLIIGPIVVIARFWSKQGQMILSDDRRYAGVWIGHFLGCALVLFWVMVVCDLLLWQYIVLFVWPGLSLTLLRSFTEHRPAQDTDQRTIIIEGSRLTRLLFLNNNYHHVHHSEPELAWYRLATRYNHRRESVNRENGGFYFKGYFTLFRNYLLKPKDAPVYPIA